MRNIRLALAGALFASAAVAGCTMPTSKADQAIIGAGVGAVAADLTGQSVAAGAVAGAAAGYICDDLGVCRPRR
ncbi:MAG: hypothetical protein Q4G25_05865 [Paracoccus sp. (in: a-proteobacteria)]|nr:hypothetical protein [Paracoccus sp. (in: a-proteobacteria)]